jgi:hypothetical protein
MDLGFLASGLPDEEALYGLWQYVRELPLRPGLSSAAACHTLNDVIVALVNYDLGVRSQPSRLIRFVRDLSAFARKQTTVEMIALLERRVADPQRGPAVLVALWKGGKAAGLARDKDEDGRPILGVKIEGIWQCVVGDIEDRLRCLAGDPVAFAAAARKALYFAKKNSPQDWLRPLRDLMDHPTRRKFEALLKNGTHDDDNELKIYFSVLRQAARRLYGGNLPMTWQRQIAADPGRIKAVAQGARQLLKAHPKAPGLPRDPAQDIYDTRLCEIYQAHTGEMVSYSTAWPTSKSHPEGSRFGPALTFVQLGLRLIDPSASEHQARACIDRYRDRFLEGQNSSRRDLWA